MTQYADKRLWVTSGGEIASRRRCLTAPLGTDAPGFGRDTRVAQAPAGTQTAPAGISAPANRRVSHKPKRTGTRVLNVLGHFPNPWRKQQEEIMQMDSGRWNPTTDDFEAVARLGQTDSVSVECSSFAQFLGLLYKNPPGSVARVNVFTHGETGSIAFSGKIAARTGLVTFEAGSLDARALEDLRNPRRFFEFPLRGKSGRNTSPKGRFGLQDVIERFSKDASIVFYACRSGVDKLLLQDTADTFRITAMGFSQMIAYCPTHGDGRITRGRIGLGSCRNAVQNYRTLTPDRVRRPGSAGH